MKQTSVRFRQPTPDEQRVLERLTVRPVQPHRVEHFEQFIVEHHYLKNAGGMVEHIRYVALHKGQWLALATWSAPAWHLKAGDTFIGWSEEQRRTRLPLLANNSRQQAITDHSNLIRRFMKLMPNAAFDMPPMLGQTSL